MPRLSIRTALVLLLSLQTLGVGLVVGWLSFQQGHASVDELASDLATEVGHRVDARIALHLAEAPLLNELNHDAIVAGDIDLFGPTLPLEELFIRHIRRFDVSLTYVGTERGDYIGARRVGPEEFTISLVNEGTKFKNERFATGADGRRQQRILRSETIYDPRQRPWYAPAAAAETPAWTDVYADYTSGVLGLTSARAVRDNHGVVRGVLATDLMLTDLREFLRALEVGQTGIVYIVDHDGMLVSSSTDAPLLRGTKEDHTRVRAVDSEHHGIAQSAATLRHGTEETRVIDVDGKPTIVHATRYHDAMGLDWTIVVSVPRADFTAHVDANLRYTMLVCAIAMVLALMVGIIGTRRLTNSLSQLTEEMGAVGHMHLDQTTMQSSVLAEVDVIREALVRMKGGLRSFGRYVPVELVRELLSQGQEATLGAEHRELTIVFSDIAGFTTISESTETAIMVEALGTYMERMNDAVHQNQGAVLQYLGDGVMALWGAPVPHADHAVRAVRGAMAMVEASRGLVEASRGTDTPLFHTRVGVNTGDVVVGNIGAPTRFDYATLGDPVNTAARIESLNKVYGTEILLGPDTARAIAGVFALRRVDRVTVAGKTQGLDIFEPLGELGKVESPILAAAAAYEAAFEHYLARDFEQAQRAFEALDGPTSEVLARRCEQYRKHPPSEDWDGSFILSHK